VITSLFFIIFMLYSNILPKELALYYLNLKSNFFLIIVSNNQGWSLIKIKSNSILSRNNKLYCYDTLMKFNSYNSYFSMIFLGFLQNYSQYIKLKGIGYKVTVLNSNLLFKLGFSHRILHLLITDSRITYLNKQWLRIENRSLFLLKEVIFIFQTMRKSNSYKKKGIFLKGALIKIKFNNKKSKV